jgi:uncharacterized protein YbaR (Trm112 family)
MVLSPQLLSTLACPQCQGPLEYRHDENRLDCQTCRLAYAIRQEIPVLLIDEATKIQ